MSNAKRGQIYIGASAQAEVLRLWTIKFIQHKTYFISWGWSLEQNVIYVPHWATFAGFFGKQQEFKIAFNSCMPGSNEQ